MCVCVCVCVCACACVCAHVCVCVCVRVFQDDQIAPGHQLLAVDDEMVLGFSVEKVKLFSNVKCFEVRV